MVSMKALVIAGLALAALATTSAHAAEGDAPSPPTAPGDALERGSGRMTERLQVTPEVMEAYSSRAAFEAALAEVKAALAALSRLLEELRREKKREAIHRGEVKEHINAVAQGMAEIQTEIDDLGNAIYDAEAAMMLIVAAELRKKRAEFSKKLAVLDADRAESKAEWVKSDSKIAYLERRIVEVREAHRAEKEKARELVRQRRMVSLTAPSEGARLLVDSSGELRIKAPVPPTAVRIEIQKAPEAPPGRKPPAAGWSLFYDRTWEWKQLGSAGPNAAVLRFATTETLRVRSPTGGTGTLTLDRGHYRARVYRIATAGGADRGSASGDVGQESAGGGFGEAPGGSGPAGGHAGQEPAGGEPSAQRGPSGEGFGEAPGDSGSAGMEPSAQWGPGGGGAGSAGEAPGGSSSAASEWRTFLVVGKIRPDALTSRPPKVRTLKRAQPGASGKAVPVRPPPGGRAKQDPEDEPDERIDPSVLGRPHRH